MHRIFDFCITKKVISQNLENTDLWQHFFNFTESASYLQGSKLQIRILRPKNRGIGTRGVVLYVFKSLMPGLWTKMLVSHPFRPDRIYLVVSWRIKPFKQRLPYQRQQGMFLGKLWSCSAVLSFAESRNDFCFSSLYQFTDKLNLSQKSSIFRRKF